MVDQGEGGRALHQRVLFSRFARAGRRAATTSTCYEATVVPWLWFLTRSTDCRIFQEMTIPDIVDADLHRLRLLRSWSSSTPRGHLRRLEYVRPVPRDRLQLRQPPHGARGHLLLLQARERQLAQARPGRTAQRPRRPSRATRRSPPRHHARPTARGRAPEWSRRVPRRARQVLPRATSDFKVPGKDLNSEKEIASSTPRPAPVFDYPGDYVEKSSGDTPRRGPHGGAGRPARRLPRRSDARGLTVGCKFTLTGALARRRQHRLRDHLMNAKATRGFVGEQDPDEEVYGRSSPCIPATTRFPPRRSDAQAPDQRPPDRHRLRARRRGSPTDEFGAREGPLPLGPLNEADDQCSCWIRVAQLWAWAQLRSCSYHASARRSSSSSWRATPTGRSSPAGCTNGEPGPLPAPDNKTMSTIVAGVSGPP